MVVGSYAPIDVSAGRYRATVAVRHLAGCLALAGLTACYLPSAAPEPAPVTLQTRFEPEAVAWSGEAGENSINGIALLRTRGGEVRTCAALDAALVPWSRYAGERMAHLYGNIRGGFNAAGWMGRHPRWANDDPTFYDHVRTTKCDAEGHFDFDGLPDGEWYIEAIVTWEAPGSGEQGGTLMQRVKLKGGQELKVVLTR